MTYTVDFIDGDVLRWSLMPDGIEVDRDTDYTPTVYVGVRDGRIEKLDELRKVLAADLKVVGTCWERWFTSLRDDEPEDVLRVDIERIDDVRPWSERSGRSPRPTAMRRARSSCTTRTSRRSSGTASRPGSTRRPRTA